MPVQPPALPPVNIAPQTPPARPPVAAWRWWVHLFVLASYVLGIGLFGALQSDDTPSPATGEGDTSEETQNERPPPALSADPIELIASTGLQLALFAAFFGVAWIASRANREELLLRWNRRWWQPWVFGFAYSIAMRLVLGVIVTVVLGVAAAWIMFNQGDGFSQTGFNDAASEVGRELQPDMSHLVDAEAIENSPLYLLLNATLISFVLAGFREELWRAGMLAGCRALFPKLYGTRSGQILFVVLIAVVFGLGHLPQGWGGVFLTTLLGLILGIIMVFHRSIWEATLAHGFFNALSFVGMHVLYRLKDHYPELQKMLGGG